LGQRKQEKKISPEWENAMSLWTIFYLINPHVTLVQANLAKPFLQIIKHNVVIFIFTFVLAHQAVLSFNYSLCHRLRSPNTPLGM